MLLLADWVLPISGPPIPDGALAVSGRIIEAVGPAAQLRIRFPHKSEHAFPGCALLPGFVNVHTHLDYSAFQGFTRSCSFSEWMARLLLARRRLDENDYAVSALWGAYECLRSGVTSIADTSYTGWTVGRAARVAGLRARVYVEVFGLDDAHLPESMERLQDALAKTRHEWRAGCVDTTETAGLGPEIEVGVSPHAPYTVSSRLYREAARFARRGSLSLATHVAESQAEVELLERGSGAISQVYKAAQLWSGRRWTPPGVSPMQYVNRAGALSPTTLVVHAVHLDGEDLTILAESGAAVAHCPRSNLRLRCGTAPVSALRAAGVRVGLGTDSLASNDSLDMFAEMRAALAASQERGAMGAITPEVALRMATLDGARALGWDSVTGSLEAGKRADVIAVRVPSRGDLSGGSAAAAWSVREPTGALVGDCVAADIQMTMVEGLVVYRGEAVPVEVERSFGRTRTKLGLGD